MKALVFFASIIVMTSCLDVVKDMTGVTTAHIEIPEENLIGCFENVVKAHVGITKDNKYIFFELQDIFYTYEEIEPMIIQKMNASCEEDNRIKITGDQDADYQYVFKIIALAKANEWKPILVFTNN